MAKPLAVSSIRKTVKAPPPPPPPVVPGQTVYVTVLPRVFFGDVHYCSPKVFATREAAQADCDSLNKTRMSHNPQFVIQEMLVN